MASEALSLEQYGLTSEWTKEKWDNLVVLRGHLPLAVTENKKFKPLCRKLLKRKGPESVQMAANLAQNLYNSSCRDLLRSFLESAQFANILATYQGPEVLDFCLLLARQLPTALKTRSQIEASEIYTRFKESQRDKAELLKYYLDNTNFERDLDSLISEFRSTVFDMGLKDIADLSKSSITNVDELEFYLNELSQDQLDVLGDKFGVSPSKSVVASLFTDFKPPQVSHILEPHLVIDTGVYISIEDCIQTQRTKLRNQIYETASKRFERMIHKLETGTYKYGAPAQFVMTKSLASHIMQPQKCVYEVQIDTEDLSEQGQKEFGHLTPGDHVILAKKSSMWTGRVLTKLPLTVETIRQRAEYVLIPPDQGLLAQLSLDVSDRWPEFLTRALLGWGYKPEQAETSAEFIKVNPLAVIAVAPGGQIPELDLTGMGRILIVGTQADIPNQPRTYRGESMVPVLKTLLTKVGELAEAHELTAFYKNDWPTAQYIGKRLKMTDSELFQELEWLSPLLTLDPAYHEDYLCKTANVVVSKEPLQGNFDAIVVYHAERWSELETLSMVHSDLKHLVLVGQASPLPSLFSRLIDYGVHFCQGPLDVPMNIAALYSDWYPTLTAEKSEVLPGFADNLQTIWVDGYEAGAFNEQHIGTAEYAVLLYQYLRLLGYPQANILITAETVGQKELIKEIAIARNCGEPPFCGLPKIILPARGADEAAADVIIFSGVWACGARNESIAVYGKRGGFFLIPGSGKSDLEIVFGELYDRVVDDRVSTPLVGLRHLADYVQDMTKANLAKQKKTNNKH